MSVVSLKLMATPRRQENDDENNNEIDLTKFLLSDDENPPPSTQNNFAVENQQLVQHHYLQSVEVTVVIRQLPSQGLSFQLWPAAATLVSLFDRHRVDPISSPLSPTLAAFSSLPLNVLELGSGTGLVGIAAALTLRANVTVTDLPHVIPNLQFNVDANVGILGGSVRAAQLKWGEVGDVEEVGREFDLVVASDVVYYDNLYKPLLDTLRLIMGERGERKVAFVMAHLRRWKKDSVFFKRAKKIFDVEVIFTDGPCGGSRTGVVVYRFTPKGQKNLSFLA